MKHEENNSSMVKLNVEENKIKGQLVVSKRI